MAQAPVLEYLNIGTRTHSGDTTCW